jgi:hypothetical protein
MAQEILYPNAAGDETSITAQYPNSTSHYDKVDDTPYTSSDGAGTYVETFSTSYQRDLYNFQPHSIGSGTIDSVAIFLVVLGPFAHVKVSQKSGATVTDGTETAASFGSWSICYQTYALNPATGAAYTWAEIDALQAGVSLHGETGGDFVRCTQCYIIVTYHVSGAGGIVVTDALTRVTSLNHYYDRANKIYRLGIGMGGLSTIPALPTNDGMMPIVAVSKEPMPVPINSVGMIPPPVTDTGIPYSPELIPTPAVVTGPPPDFSSNNPAFAGSETTAIVDTTPNTWSTPNPTPPPVVPPFNPFPDNDQYSFNTAETDPFPNLAPPPLPDNDQYNPGWPKEPDFGSGGGSGSGAPSKPGKGGIIWE